MFDIGFIELLVVGIVALIVVGPKDLPGMFRTLGRFTARARALGKEFTSAMNAAADESGMRDVTKDLKGMTNPRSYGLDKLNEAADKFDKWDPTKPGKEAETSEKAVSTALDPERQADIEKIRAATEKAGQARLDREKAEKAEAEAPKKAVKGKPPERPKPKPKAEPAAPDDAPAEATDAEAKPARKPAAKKPAAKKAPAKKPASKIKKAAPEAPAKADKADEA